MQVGKRESLVLNPQLSNIGPINLSDKASLSFINEPRSVQSNFEHQMREARLYLSFLLNKGLIRLDHLSGSIVDFGCGSGGSSVVLAEFGGAVTAVDLSQAALNYAKRAIGNFGNCVLGDGINYLRSLPALSLDLVTAFLLGPDTSGDLTRSFFEAAQHALKRDGRLICASDYETIAWLKRVVPRGNGAFIQLEDPLHPLFVGGAVHCTDCSLAATTLPSLPKTR